jgi:hypothetical protein
MWKAPQKPRLYIPNPELVRVDHPNSVKARPFETNAPEKRDISKSPGVPSKFRHPGSESVVVALSNVTAIEIVGESAMAGATATTITMIVATINLLIFLIGISFYSLIRFQHQQALILPLWHKMVILSKL